MAVILGLALILVGIWLRVSRQPYPKTGGSVQVDGLTAPVQVSRDGHGVPHIYAETSEDLFFAQGYVHAQDRFWQMEFWRRIGSGRLSEYFGKATLGQDMYLRTMGFARVAEEEYAQSDERTRRILEAYAAGVNAYVLNRKPTQLGLEFALLGLQGVQIDIEPWTPINTLTWAHVMSQDMGGNMSAELYRVDLIRKVGLRMTADLMPGFREDFPYIIPDEELGFLGSASTRTIPDLAYLESINTELVGAFDPARALAFGKGAGIGSNNWTISGRLTDSGMPILANDPHLDIQMPSIWYEVGLHCDPKSDDCPYDARGFSFAGAPGVIIGHNDRIAWGMTNVNPDVQDLYVERLNPDNIDQYQVNGEWVDMEIIREEIIVHGEDEPVVLRVRVTRHGPIITDLEGYADYAHLNTTGEPPEITALALRWTALEPNRTLRAILLLEVAQDYDEFREALRHFDSPSQNFVYADVDGNIGYQMPGMVPIRAKGDGSLPVPGWTDDYEWIGFIPYDQLPRVYNPQQGYIVTANQPVVEEGYPYLILYTPDFDHGYRARRIVDLIQTDGDGISVEDVQAIQSDNLNLSALEILPYLADVSFESRDLEAARDRLLRWDGQMRMDSPEAALYGYFWVALIEDTFGDELPEDLAPRSGEHAMSIFYILLQDPANAWWDDVTTHETESRDDILARAFEHGHATAVERLGGNFERWSWGKVHTATFENQTLGQSGIALIEAIFNRGPFPTSGGGGMINATSWKLQDPFTVTSVPSMRQIIDLGDLSNSLVVHTTGQSGHAGHRHYDDMIDSWRFIEYHPTLWSRPEVEASSREHLSLLPAR